MNIDRTGVTASFSLNSTRTHSSDKGFDLSVTDRARDIHPERREIAVNSTPEIQQALTFEEVNALRDSFFIDKAGESNESKETSKVISGMYNLRGQSAVQNPVNSRGNLLDVVG